MGIEIVQGTSQKPASSEELVKLLRKQPDLSGQLFVGYPIIRTTVGPHPIDALLISMYMGIVVFDLIEGGKLDGFEYRQDDSANKLEARLKNYSELMERRDLRIPIHTVSFGTAVRDPIRENVNYPVVNLNTTLEQLNKFTWPEADRDVFEKTLSAIQNVSTIRSTGSRRTVQRKNSRGAKLKRLEDSIATLDNAQSRAVIQTVEGVQRIRGLAGSGKTIVLALKAVYLHAQHPEWRIAVTFNTRSLKGHFQRLINNFCVEQTSEEPDWEKLQILNAWGAPGSPERNGIYYEFCHENAIEYLDFQSARKMFGTSGEFSKACEYALSQVRNSKKLYDVILIDEAQDFSPDFLRLCYLLLKEPERLVYAYDELQNLSGESLPPMDEIFGQSNDNPQSENHNKTNINGPKQDIILDRCYRNSRPVLVTAHALGFGVYRETPKRKRTGLIQMFDNSHLWTEVGYRVHSGSLADGSSVSLERTNETSPSFLEEHSPNEDLVEFVKFKNQIDQVEWLVQAIQRNLKEDELRHSDIIVINPDPLKTRETVGPARGLLLDKGIRSHLAGVDTSPDTFFRPDSESVTFTGIHRAKGNEAGMVYVMNAQDCHSSAWNLATIRNRLFTAITRSKSWIRVLGLGHSMEALQREYEELKSRNFRLEFTYPDLELRQQLLIVHRDMSAQERKHLESSQKYSRQLATDLESGNLQPEDLDPDVLAKLLELLRKF